MRKAAWTKEKVQDSAPTGAGGLGRCVKQKWPHDESRATWPSADDLRLCLASDGGRSGFNATAQVRTRHYSKRTIGESAAVDVEANSHQLLKEFDGRLNEEGAFLFGPPVQTGVVYACRYRDAEVLMDCDKPVAR